MSKKQLVVRPRDAGVGDDIRRRIAGGGWWSIQTQAMNEVEGFKTQYSVNEVDPEEDAFTDMQWMLFLYRQSCKKRFGGPSLSPCPPPVAGIHPQLSTGQTPCYPHS